MTESAREEDFSMTLEDAIAVWIAIKENGLGINAESTCETRQAELLRDKAVQIIMEHGQKVQHAAGALEER